MSKKLLGERQIGDQVYPKDTIMTDEEAAATGLPDSDFAVVAEPKAEAEVEATPEAPADKGAEVDVQAKEGEQKNEQEQSSQTGSDNGASASDAQKETAPEDVETEEHVLTEQDLKDNPELLEKGLEVGSVVRVPVQKS